MSSFPPVPGQVSGALSRDRSPRRYGPTTRLASIKWGWGCVRKATTMKLCTSSLLLLHFVVTQTYGAIYDQVSQLPTYGYDYIVVGGTLQFSHHELEGGLTAIIVRWHCWQCGCKPFDRRQQHTSAYPRSWRKVSRAEQSTTHDTRRSLSCSNEGVLASIIPLLCLTLSPQTVSSIESVNCSLLFTDRTAI